MLLAGKIFCCPTIQLFFTIIVVGIINTGANYAEPPVAASLSPIVNSVAMFSGDSYLTLQIWHTSGPKHELLQLSFELQMVFLGVSCTAGDDVDG